MSLSEDLRNYKKAELKRLSAELKFAGKIKNNIDTVLDPIIKDIYKATTTDLDEHSSLSEDQSIAMSMVQSTLNKTVDPGMQTTVSDSVNRNLGKIIGMTLGSQETANLVSSVANIASSPSTSGLATIPQGGIGSTSELASDVYDMSKKMQQKVLNVVSIALTNKPGLLPEFAMLSILEFKTSASKLTASFRRLSELTAIIKTSTTALDATYYTTGAFNRTTNAKPILQEADARLLTVRREILATPAQFQKDSYAQIRENNILQAANALVNYGNTNNKVAELQGASSALDYLFADIDGTYSDFREHLEALAEFYESFETNMKFEGSMFAQVNQVQAEVRSIIRSMEAALYLNKGSTMPTMERLWYMELLTMYQKMIMSPTNISDYIASDPDGYVLDYAPIAAELQEDLAEFDADMSQLKALIDQLKYWIQRKLSDSWPNDPRIQNAINNLVVSVDAISSSNENLISVAIGHASSYDVPTSDMTGKILTMVSDTRMDKASDYLKKGKWKKFFSVTPDNASTKGSLVSSINSMMSSVVSGSTSSSGASSPQITFTSLEPIANAQNKVIDQKRADDLLSSIIGRVKNDGQKEALEDIREILDICGGLEQANQYPQDF